MASVPEDTELLNYQTTVLKVSIHCEACKKKVKKILQKLEGVYSIDINSKQNKVTVTGCAAAESLIRRLVKYGKHAELWPEKQPAATISSCSGNADTKLDAPVPKTDQLILNTEKQQQSEELSNETIPLPPAESTATAPAAVEAGASGEADELEKKGKETQIETSSVDESAVANTNKGESTTAAAAPAHAAAADIGPPPPEKFPLQVDSVSYRAVQPSTSYAYYMYSPAVASSYTYTGDQPPSVYPPENYMWDPYYGSMEAPARSGGSYDMFNDENPNACRLM